MTMRQASAFILLLMAITLSVWVSQVQLRTKTPQAAQERWQYITIHRTYSDIDGREVAVPAVYVREETELGGVLQTRYDGPVIARELPSGEWLIRVGDREFKTRDKRESVTYFDLGPSPDNPGAIRS